MDNLSSLSYFIPELTLTVTLLLVLCSDLLHREQEGLDFPAWLALVGMFVAFVAHFGLYGKPAVSLFEGMIAHDPFAVFFKGFFIFCTFIIVLLSIYSSEVFYYRKSEYLAILSAICLGMCLTASSTNLIMLYLSIELMSIGSYLLAGFARSGGKTDEAAIKYVLFGAMSTGVMLFGMSILYGLTGTMDIAGIRQVLFANVSSDPVVLLSFLFVLVGAGYKIAAVPFHFWCPDVYEGAPTPVTAFLSVASKGTGFALLIRFFYRAMLQPAGEGTWSSLPAIDWMLLFAILSAVTMTAGNLGAMPQRNIKRLLAYSAIAHAGYLLMGIAALTSEGIASILFYLVMYLFTNLTAFLVVMILVNRTGEDEIPSYRGLWQRAPLPAVVMAIALISLTGLPPTAGFVGKLYLFIAAWHSGLYWLVVVAVLNSVVSLYYYFRIVRAMFLETGPDTAISHQPVYETVLVLLAAPILLLMIFFGPVLRLAQYCAQMLP
ncbi:MAG TPA: NADH-quinone oxidoreductase subunit N [bacterium]|nr:NADH-quinone oxidoreductase subunit N [bacterium]HQL63766.1 NADH-quinone oxidoreductase subunit N [bacterium]